MEQRPSRCRTRQIRPHTPLHLEQLKHIKTQYLSHQHDITIDRDTVLKINRLATRRNLYRRDNSWPPPQQQQQEREKVEIKRRNKSSDNMKSISNICEKFNSPTRIIEPTPKEVQEKRQKQRQNQSSIMKNMTESNNISVIVDDDDADINSMMTTPQQKGFSSPETRAADELIGLVEPKRQYYEQLAIVGLNVKNPKSGMESRLLPPLKPRSFSAKNQQSKQQQQQQRRSIKMATEIKIYYDSDLEHIPLPDIPIDTTSVQKNHKNVEEQEEHIVPMKVKSGDSTKSNLLDISSVQEKLVDNACIYLRSVDLKDNTIAYIPAAITIIPDMQKSEDITKLTNKYDELQHSIAEHLRQIDDYMTQAKQALNRCLEIGLENNNESSKYDVELWPNDLVRETPLQTLYKQIAQPPVDADIKVQLAQFPAENVTELAKENMPVIEKALAELATISETVENTEISELPELHIVEVKRVAELQQPAEHVLIEEEEKNEKLVDDHFDTYQATYEIPSPFRLKRQISWSVDKAQQVENKDTQLSIIVDNSIQPQKDFVSKEEWQPFISSEHRQYLREQSIQELQLQAEPEPEPPIRKYPAGLIEPHVHKRAASPFGLNVVEKVQPPTSLTTTSHDDYVYVSQNEGHNMGLLVHSPTPPPPPLPIPSPSPPRTISGNKQGWIKILKEILNIIEFL